MMRVSHHLKLKWPMMYAIQWLGRKQCSGDDPSDNGASDSDDHDEEEELSIKLSETALDELTAEAFTHSFTNSQSQNCGRY